MHREYKPCSRSERVIGVAIALVVTALLHGVVFGLAGHYDRQYLRSATLRANATVASHPGKAAVDGGTSS